MSLLLIAAILVLVALFNDVSLPVKLPREDPWEKLI